MCSKRKEPERWSVIRIIVFLNNQVKIPCAAFGTYKAAEGNSADIIGTAIRAGYRHFDTASVYGTEKYVAEAIEKSRIPRQEFFSDIQGLERGYGI